MKNETLLSVVSTKIGNSIQNVLFADVNFVHSLHISFHLYKSSIVFGMAIKDK